MAESGAKQFLEQLCNDVSLRAQYRTSGATKANEIMDFALSKGYIFTEAELRETLKDFPEHMAIDQMCEALKIPRNRQSAQSK